MKDFLRNAKEFAQTKNGDCLSLTYHKAKDNLIWKCSNPTHKQWEASYDSIINKKTWCPTCLADNLKMNLKKQAEKFHKKCQDYAFSKEGKLISKTYETAKKHLTWKCSNNKHPEFKMSYFNAVKNQRWCPLCKTANCSNQYKNNIDAILKEHNGTLVEEPPKTINSNTDIYLKCSNSEHNPWVVSYGNLVYHKTWCPECAGKFTKDIFEEKILAYAEKNNGTLISGTYKEQSSRFFFKCSNAKHEIFNISYKSIKKNVWCKQCSRENRIKESQSYLNVAKNHATKHSGFLISKEYINSNHKLTWKCSNPTHPTFESSFSNVVYSDRWCPRCSGFFTKEELFYFAEDFAKKRGGKLLSKTVPNLKTVLDWKCNVSSHKIFHKPLRNIKTYNSWCPECHSAKNIQETYFKIILEQLLQIPLVKSKPKWNINPLTNQLLELDGYNEEKHFAFEFQGRQHFIDIFKNQSLKKQQIRDDIKKQNCLKNNVFLLEIKEHYNIKTPNKMIDHIVKLLESNNIQYYLDRDLIIQKINQAYIVKDGYSNTFLKLSKK